MMSRCIEAVVSAGSVSNKALITTREYRRMLGNSEEAESLLNEALTESTRLGRERAIIGIKIRLAEIALDKVNDAEAAMLLEEVQAKAIGYQDRENLALLQPVAARLHALRGDIPAARASLAEAIDLFERLGMRRELAEARAELANLEAPDAPVSSAPGA